MLNAPHSSAWLLSTDSDEGILRPLEIYNKNKRQDSYKFIRISRVCSGCIAKGRHVARRCRHRIHLAPYYQSKTKERKVGDLYDAVGDKDAFEKELLAYVDSGLTGFFNMPQVEVATAARTVEEYPDCEPGEDDTIYVGIDPSGGGVSFQGLIAVFFSKKHGKYFVILISVQDVRQDPVTVAANAIYNAMEYLCGRYPNTRIVVACEDMPKGTMMTISHIVATFPNTRFIKRSTKTVAGGNGISLDDSLKSLIFNNVADKLAHDMVRISPHLEAQTNLSTVFRGVDMKTPVGLMIEMLRYNMLSVQQEGKKIHGKKNSQDPLIANDDIAVALCYAMYGPAFVLDPRVRFRKSVIDG